MNNNLSTPILLAAGAALGFGVLFMLIELLPFIVVGGVGFLIWKLTMLTQENSQLCNHGLKKK